MNGQNEKEIAFLQEIAEVCKRHGISISHEDQHGSFVLETYSESFMEWLLSAYPGEECQSQHNGLKCSLTRGHEGQHTAGRYTDDRQRYIVESW